MFEVVCKKSCFSRQFVKLIVKVYLVLHVGPTGTRNQDLRHSKNHFDGTTLMVVSELANEFPQKITFFEISTIVSICVKF